MKETISLAYSPCPNDTFLFYHLVKSGLSEEFLVKEELHDVEHLNQAAEKNIYNVTKLSFFAYFHVMNHYNLLNCGSALGRGCGPLLVKKKGKKIGSPENQKILVPGILTTANLLLNIYLGGQFTPKPVRYDLIIPSLLKEEFDLGLVIHEERFTYEKKGLEKVQDLGEFWEQKTKLPIPLGAIAIQKQIDLKTQILFDQTLHRSLLKAYEDPEIPKDYILTHSQDKDPKVVQSHIDLYVNEFTKDLGDEGKEAILHLKKEAIKIGLLNPKHDREDFILSH